MGEGISREEILKELAALAFGRCNDAARLALMGKGDLKKIGRLDLRAVTALHVNEKGGFDLKLLDRTKAIELLLAALREGEGESSAAEKAEPGAELAAAIELAAGRLGAAGQEEEKA